MKKLTYILSAILTAATMLFSQQAKADEGMWVVGHIPAKTDSLLHSLGLELTDEELYSENGPSLNNAVVMFGGFCSGVVVSPDGLVFTNHHCGFGSIQNHSSVKHDYLKYGFVAKTFADELPNEDLYVAFHLKTVDVTDLILDAAPYNLPSDVRDAIIDSISDKLTNMVNYSAKGVYSEVNPFYRGSKYYLSVYQRFDDVRLVFAPPQCLGKYGGDTDNWMWPRQTCDFSVFRIYADKNNQPAEYSKDNVPYHPISYAHVSTQGYSPGSYAMTLGYPGRTDRYLSSFGVASTMSTTNDVRYQVRTVKLDVLREAMQKNDAIRIMYASKYDQSSNYWKFSLGQNQALKNLNVISEKQQLEREYSNWVAKGDDNRKAMYGDVLDSLKVIYARNEDGLFDYNLWIESFYSGSDILGFLLKTMTGKISDDSEFAERIKKTYKDIDVETDKKVLKALYANYINKARWIPDSLRATPDFNIDTINARIESTYARSVFAQPEQITQVNGIEEIVRDPMVEIAINALTLLQSSGTISSRSGTSPYEYERLLCDGIREMNHDKDFYPDANFTLRLSYGLCEPINFAPGTTGLKEEATEMITSPQSFINKYENALQSGTAEEKRDYELIPAVVKWMKAGKFSKRYINPETGKLPLCFLTTNDITGGNSGSGVYDGKGRLIGLAFDGNWEAMSGDIKFDTNLQRCICVDIRYVLSVIEDYSNAKRIINELTLE